MQEQKTWKRKQGRVTEDGKEGQILNRKPSILGTLKLETNNRELEK